MSNSMIVECLNVIFPSDISDMIWCFCCDASYNVEAGEMPVDIKNNYILLRTSNGFKIASFNSKRSITINDPVQFFCVDNDLIFVSTFFSVTIYDNFKFFNTYTFNMSILSVSIAWKLLYVLHSNSIVSIIGHNKKNNITYNKNYAQIASNWNNLFLSDNKIIDVFPINTSVPSKTIIYSIDITFISGPRQLFCHFNNLYIANNDIFIIYNTDNNFLTWEYKKIIEFNKKNKLITIDENSVNIYYGNIIEKYGKKLLLTPIIC